MRAYFQLALVDVARSTASILLPHGLLFRNTLNETLRESAISIFAVRSEDSKSREFHLLLLRASFTYRENKAAYSL
jgi:hypothetical protein